jgi:hypothetical protein
MSNVRPIKREHHLIDQVGRILVSECFKMFCFLIRTLPQVFSAFDEEKKGYLSRKQLKSAKISLFLFRCWVMSPFRYACVALLGHRLPRHELHALAPEKFGQTQ